MNDLVGRIAGFEQRVFPEKAGLYGRLAREGQRPQALMISCADSRVVPEQLLRADPGDLFVCRNAGNIVPPSGAEAGGVSATVEYALLALGVRDIIVCGHSDCGAMKGVAAGAEALAGLPAVADWLRHAPAAAEHPGPAAPDASERLRAITLENVVAQLAHLRTHPSVAAGIARGEIALHGWYVDIAAGRILALDGETGRFETLREDRPLPMALRPVPRRAVDGELLVAAG